MVAAAAIPELDDSTSAQVLVATGHLAWSDADRHGMTEVAGRLSKLEIPARLPQRFSVGVMLGLPGDPCRSGHRRCRAHAGHRSSGRASRR